MIMNDTQSLLLYFSVFFSSAILVHYGIKFKRNYLIFLSFLFPVLLGSLRYGVGTDYSNYVILFNNFSKLPLEQFIYSNANNIEPGLYVVARIANIFPYAINLYFGLITFGTLFFLYLGLRRFRISYLPIALLLYYLMLFPISFNAVRQMLAVSIFFYATSFIYQKKLFKYVCLILLAALFHKSAILLIPVYIVGIILPPKFRINTRTFVIILLTLSAVIVTGQYMFTFLLNLSLLEKYSKYQYYSESATGLVLFTKLLILGSVTLMFNRMRSYSNFAFIYIMSITEVMILILARGSIDLSRFSLYFSIFPIILLANLIRVFERNSRYIVVAGLITYALAIFIISFYIKGGAEIFPYKALLIRSTP